MNIPTTLSTWCEELTQPEGPFCIQSLECTSPQKSPTPFCKGPAWGRPTALLLEDPSCPQAPRSPSLASSLPTSSFHQQTRSPLDNDLSSYFLSPAHGSSWAPFLLPSLVELFKHYLSVHLCLCFLFPLWKAMIFCIYLFASPPSRKAVFSVTSLFWHLRRVDFSPCSAFYLLLGQTLKPATCRTGNWQIQWALS